MRTMRFRRDQRDVSPYERSEQLVEELDAMAESLQQASLDLRAYGNLVKAELDYEKRETA